MRMRLPLSRRTRMELPLRHSMKSTIVIPFSMFVRLRSKIVPTFAPHFSHPFLSNTEMQPLLVTGVAVSCFPSPIETCDWRNYPSSRKSWLGLVLQSQGNAKDKAKAERHLGE